MSSILKFPEHSLIISKPEEILKHSGDSTEYIEIPRPFFEYDMITVTHSRPDASNGTIVRETFINEYPADELVLSTANEFIIEIGYYLLIYINKENQRLIKTKSGLLSGHYITLNGYFFVRSTEPVLLKEFVTESTITPIDSSMFEGYRKITFKIKFLNNGFYSIASKTILLSDIKSELQTQQNEGIDYIIFWMSVINKGGSFNITTDNEYRISVTHTGMIVQIYGEY